MMMTKELEITDHAIVRWLERVYGISRKSLADIILDDTVKNAAKLKASRLKYNDCIYCFNPYGTKLLTIYKKGDDDVSDDRYG